VVAFGRGRVSGEFGGDGAGASVLLEAFLDIIRDVVLVARSGYANGGGFVDRRVREGGLCGRKGCFVFGWFAGLGYGVFWVRRGRAKKVAEGETVLAFLMGED
jgi:hypothetical protein